MNLETQNIQVNLQTLKQDEYVQISRIHFVDHKDQELYIVFYYLHM